MARRIVLRSSLDPVALATVLKARMPVTLGPNVPAGVIGQGSDRDMTLWYRRPDVTNSFQTRLVATIDPDGTGSRIAGRIGMSRSVGVFMGCWFGFLLFFIATAVPIVMVGHAPAAFTLPFLGIPAAMMGFGVLLLWIGRWHGNSDEAAILAFLAQTIDARPI